MNDDLERRLATEWPSIDEFLVCQACGATMKPIGHILIYDRAFECQSCHYKEYWRIHITRIYPEGYREPKPPKLPDPPRLHNFRKVYK